MMTPSGMARAAVTLLALAPFARAVLIENSLVRFCLAEVGCTHM